MTDWRIEPFRADHLRSDFSCGIPSLDDFLRLRVSQYEHRQLGKTFVAVSSTHMQVRGYYTIAASSIAFESLPSELGRKLPRHPVPSVLIARLAVARAYQRRLLGEALLLNSLRRAESLSGELGIHAVQVDALDERASGFYRKYGFVPLEDQPLRLLLPITTIRAGITRR